MTLPFLPAHHHQMGPSLYLWIWTPWCQAFSLLFPRARILWHLLLPILLLVQNLRFWLLLPTQVVVLLLPRPRWHLPLPILLWFRIFGFGDSASFTSASSSLASASSIFASGSESSVLASSSDSGCCSSFTSASGSLASASSDFASGSESSVLASSDRPLKLLKQVSYYFFYLL